MEENEQQTAFSVLVNENVAFFVALLFDVQIKGKFDANALKSRSYIFYLLDAYIWILIICV